MYKKKSFQDVLEQMYFPDLNLDKKRRLYFYLFLPPPPLPLFFIQLWRACKARERVSPAGFWAMRIDKFVISSRDPVSPVRAKENSRRMAAGNKRFAPVEIELFTWLRVLWKIVMNFGSRVVSLNFRNLNVEHGRIIAQVAAARVTRHAELIHTRYS